MAVHSKHAFITDNSQPETFERNYALPRGNPPVPYNFVSGPRRLVDWRNWKRIRRQQDQPIANPSSGRVRVSDGITEAEVRGDSAPTNGHVGRTSIGVEAMEVQGGDSRRPSTHRSESRSSTVAAARNTAASARSVAASTIPNARGLTQAESSPPPPAMQIPASESRDQRLVRRHRDWKSRNQAAVPVCA